MVATALNNGAVVYGCLSASKTEKIGGKLSIFNQSLREVNGGEGGIRTLDTLPYTHFPGVLLRPLGHLS